MKSAFLPKILVRTIQVKKRRKSPEETLAVKNKYIIYINKL